MTPRQLAFDLVARPALGRGDFFVSKANAEALAMIENAADWPGGKLVLIGEPGAGKTHLAHVWAALESARAVTPETGLSTLDTAIFVDHAERWIGTYEEALLHLYNIATERRLPLLLTARHPPAAWPVTLPDLKSRLSSLAVARIAPPDDDLLRAVMAKLFTDHQIAPSPALIDWAVARIERSFDAVRDFVDRLDTLSLAEGRRPSRALASRLLQAEERA